MLCGKEGRFSKRQGLSLRRYSGSSPLESFDLHLLFPVLGDKVLLKLLQSLLGDRFSQSGEWEHSGRVKLCVITMRQKENLGLGRQLSL